jgi:hypothetical protein
VGSKTSVVAFGGVWRQASFGLSAVGLFCSCVMGGVLGDDALAPEMYEEQWRRGVLLLDETVLPVRNAGPSFAFRAIALALI